MKIQKTNTTVPMKRPNIINYITNSEFQKSFTSWFSNLIDHVSTPESVLNLANKSCFFTSIKKELIQDAFLCWVLEWFNFKGHSMYDFACLLLENFINDSPYKGIIALSDIQRVDIKMQHRKIDILILAKLNDNRILPIIIEDKINSNYFNSNRYDRFQIDRYRNVIMKEYKDFPEPICIYYKTGITCESTAELFAHHYILYDKYRMLELMKNFKDVNMPILFCDYYVHLHEMSKLENFDLEF